MSDIVEAMSPAAGVPGAFLGQLYDPQRSVYLVPAHPDRPPGPNFSARVQCSVGQPLVGIIDSGLLQGHPWVVRTQSEAVDFTGEGVDDRNGHGTLSALRLLLDAPTTCLVNVKVLDERAQGTREQLIAALDWVAARGLAIANLSLGIWDERCRGDCTVCLAAERAAAAGVMISAAAGNRAGTTSCPGKLGRYRDPAPIIVVGAWDWDRQRIADQSGLPGKGGVMGDVYRYRLIPAD